MLFAGFLVFGLVFALWLLPARLNNRRVPDSLNTSMNESMDTSRGPGGNLDQTYSYCFFFVHLDLAILLVIIALINVTIFQFENILSLYLTGTLNMSSNYIGYIFSVRAFAYAIMSLITP